MLAIRGIAMSIDRRGFIAASALLSSRVLAEETAAQKPMTQSHGSSPRRPLRRIATEEAFATPEQMAGMIGLSRSGWENLDMGLWRAWGRLQPGQANRLHDQLLDLEEVRIKEMDDNGVHMQVLSLTSPGVQQFDAPTAVSIAQDANDKLAAVIARHPNRFCGLAAFAPQDPKRTPQEMDRAINQLKLNGFILNSHTNGEYLDDRKFWPMLEAAEALERPIYIHPRCPSDDMAKPFRDYGMAAGICGFHTETALHATRMILGGVFDQFPKLQIVLGHMGEGLPYWLYRIDHVWRSTGSPDRLKTGPMDTFHRNFVVTTSGVNDPKVLKFVIDQLGADNVMWAIDYPYEVTKPAVDFMNTAPISEEERHKLFYLNAERVFHIPAV
jgi:predicted TIM-barrel fold metal-dependent hydrolase